MSSQPPYRLLQTPQFKRAFVKFARKHPELRNATEGTLTSLKADPFNLNSSVGLFSDAAFAA